MKQLLTIAVINIIITPNNYLINISDLHGNIIYWVSAGLLGFKGAQKKTPFVLQTILNKIINYLIQKNIKKLEINIKGKGIGRDIVIQTFKNTSFNILAIEDKNTIIHNGCRAPKRRKL